MPRFTLIAVFAATLLVGFGLRAQQAGDPQPPSQTNANKPGEKPQTPASAAQPDESAGTEKAQNEPEAPAAPDPRAAATLAQARERFDNYTSIRAQMLETVTIGARPMTAYGTYLQSTNDRLRFELQIEIGDENRGRLTQVSDGQLLWTSWTVGTHSRVTRRDIQEIRKAVAANPSMTTQRVMSDLGMGGMKALLASLELSMDFNTYREAKIKDKNFIVIQGAWKEDFLKELGMVGEGGDAELPDQVPDLTRLYFEQESLFPRRIMYLKKLPNEDQVRPLLTLDFLNVELNAEIADASFAYEPPSDVPQVDDTREFIERTINNP